MKSKFLKFTLIELLIVIAIIGILASLLLPALAQAKFSSRIVVCKSNIKQIATGLITYTNDADGYYPTDSSIYYKANSISRPSVYNSTLSNYVGGSGYADYRNPIFLCPQAQKFGHLGNSWENYSIFPDTINGASTVDKTFNPYRPAETDRIMKRLGEKFQLHNMNFGTDNLYFNVLVSDFCYDHNYGAQPGVETNHMMKWIRATSGYGAIKTLAYAQFTTNYAFDDGAVNSLTSSWSTFRNSMTKARNTNGDWDSYLIPTAWGED